jgi:hypothetical protein
MMPAMKAYKARGVLALFEKQQKYIIFCRGFLSSGADSIAASSGRGAAPANKYEELATLWLNILIRWYERRNG